MSEEPVDKLFALMILASFHLRHGNVNAARQTMNDLRPLRERLRYSLAAEVYAMCVCMRCDLWYCSVDAVVSVVACLSSVCTVLMFVLGVIPGVHGCVPADGAAAVQ